MPSQPSDNFMHSNALESSYIDGDNGANLSVIFHSNTAVQQVNTSIIDMPANEEVSPDGF